MASTALQKRCIRVCCFLWLVDIQLHMPSCGFARTRQQPLSELRERTGHALRRSARGTDGLASPLSPDEKLLVMHIATASEDRNWTAAKEFFGTYAGSATQVYAATMHAALRCREYRAGAKIFEQCQANCKFIGEAAYTAALRIFAKLGDATRVQQIWDDALNRLKLSEFLGSARIVAAAEAGDVEAAADTLDKLNSTNVSVQTHHVNSAMRACWGWNDRQHKAAKYFFDLLPKFGLSPTVVSFTCLIGAYQTASLSQILLAYNEMKAFQVEPDTVFAETYIFSVLQVDRTERGRFQKNLQEKSINRLRAARDALTEFKVAGLRLSRACTRVDRELTRLGL